ncbi:hypothetical protein H8K52_03975 [Undibacterium seohonense]|uniref:Uncharacterized protein n=1 Tax=Undibacterium seohonense TaxID=1344950 RepID=A0ABR6X0R5_9BURK|nr:hypothetical protein [Undibacterium seohonense]MBC3806507.1 hypothetical protein [Undibacterium seohonense]
MALALTYRRNHYATAGKIAVTRFTEHLKHHCDSYICMLTSFSFTLKQVRSRMAQSPYFVETRWGGSEDSPPVKRLAEIVDELNVNDSEHPDTWLVHEESGWTLRLDEEGFAYLDDPDLSTMGHMNSVSRAKGLELWIKFVEAGPKGVESFTWVQGPRIFSELEIRNQRIESERIILESDREFFQQLGTEDQTQSGKNASCTRGRIEYSVFCAVHHFEQIRKRPCPFV